MLNLHPFHNMQPGNFNIKVRYEQYVKNNIAQLNRHAHRFLKQTDVLTLHI